MTAQEQLTSAEQPEQAEQLSGLLQHGLRHFREADYRECAQCMKAALEIAPNDSTATKVLQDVREIREALRRAVNQFKTKNYGAALAALDVVLRKNASDPNANSLHEKLCSLMATPEDIPSTPSAIGLAPDVWSFVEQDSGLSVASRAAPRRRRMIIIGGIAAAALVLTSVVAFMIIKLGARDGGKTQPATSEVSRPPSQKATPVDLAEQALAMAREDRFAVALALLEESSRRGRLEPAASAQRLRERQVEVHLEMARRLLTRGKDVAAGQACSRALSLSAGNERLTAEALRSCPKRVRTAGKGTAPPS